MFMSLSYQPGLEVPEAAAHSSNTSFVFEAYATMAFNMTAIRINTTKCEQYSDAWWAKTL